MTDPELDRLIQSVWNRNRASVEQRIRVIGEAADALQQGAGCTVDLGAAREAAHQLAGSLGTFGHPWASEVAMGLQRLLATDPVDDPALVGRRMGHLVQRLNDMLPLA